MTDQGVIRISRFPGIDKASAQINRELRRRSRTDQGVYIVEINPDFINLGLDSKGHMLPEPTIDDIEELVKVLHESGIELREKHNLSRLRRKT